MIWEALFLLRKIKSLMMLLGPAKLLEKDREYSYKATCSDM